MEVFILVLFLSFANGILSCNPSCYCSYARKTVVCTGLTQLPIPMEEMEHLIITDSYIEDLSELNDWENLKALTIEDTVFDCLQLRLIQDLLISSSCASKTTADTTTTTTASTLPITSSSTRSTTTTTSTTSTRKTTTTISTTTFAEAGTVMSTPSSTTSTTTTTTTLATSTFAEAASTASTTTLPTSTTFAEAGIEISTPWDYPPTLRVTESLSSEQMVQSTVILNSEFIPRKNYLVISLPVCGLIIILVIIITAGVIYLKIKKGKIFSVQRTPPNPPPTLSSIEQVEMTTFAMNTEESSGSEILQWDSSFDNFYENDSVSNSNNIYENDSRGSSDYEPFVWGNVLYVTNESQSHMHR